jgi:hypothetical protein
MTVIATKPMLGVNIGPEGFGRSLKVAFENGVALETTVLGRYRKAEVPKD